MHCILLALAVQHAVSFNPRGSPKPVAYISAATADVETNMRMVLDRGLRWAGEGDFGAYHQGSGITILSTLCEGSHERVALTYCFKKASHKYRFGEATPVSGIATCLNPTCTVTADRNVTLHLAKEKWARKSPEATTSLLSKFIPHPLKYNATATSKLGFTAPFAGPGFAQLFFKPLCYLLTGDLTSSDRTTVNHNVYTKPATFCVPLTLDDGSLDGVYQILAVSPDH